MTSLTVFLPVKGEAAALREALSDDPGRWLPASRHLGDDRWTTEVHGAGVRRVVVARVSPPWRSGGAVWRPLSWEPLVDEREPERVARYLPTMDGELGLHTSARRSTLVLDARYRPPGGPVGATLDALALHRIARGTADRLLADIAQRLAELAPLPAQPRTSPASPPSDRDDGP